MLLEEVLLEEVHEEEDGGDFAIDAFGFADGGVVGVADGAVGFDLSDGGVVGIADGAVGVNFADGGVVGVADGAVGFDLADGSVVGVADGAVAFDLADGGVVGVAKGLGFEGGRHEQQEGEEEGNDVFHRSGWAAMIWLHTEQKTRAAAEPLLAEKGRGGGTAAYGVGLGTLFGTALGGDEDGAVSAAGAIDGGFLEDLDVIDVVNADEVKAFDYHAIDDEEGCLVSVEAVGASDVEFGVLTGTTSLVDDETRNASLQGHGDVGVA